jgi:trimethylguanosine synthase
LTDFTQVIALDNSPTRLAIARHNAAIYGVADRIEFILTDYPSFVRSLSTPNNPNTRRRTIDVVFLSPPWGGPSYLHGPTLDLGATAIPDTELQYQDEEPYEYSLSNIQPLPGPELFQLSRQITPNIAFYLPRNANLKEIGALADPPDGKGKGREDESGTELEMVEVEEEWMNGKLKALTCYFGGLVTGQEHLFDPPPSQ